MLGSEQCSMNEFWVNKVHVIQFVAIVPIIQESLPGINMFMTQPMFLIRIIPINSI